MFSPSRLKFLPLLLAPMLLVSCAGLEWLPKYIEAKTRIDYKYRLEDNRLVFLRNSGQMSDYNFQRKRTALYSKWDTELVYAKAKAQGVSTGSTSSSSGSGRVTKKNTSSRKNTSTTTKTTSNQESNSPSKESPKPNNDIYIPLDTGDLSGGDQTGGKLD